MSRSLPTESVIEMLAALTGRWTTWEAAESLVEACGSREELLAHLVVDQHVLEPVPAARAALAAQARYAATQQALPGGFIARAPATAASLSPEAAAKILAQFAEAPEACSPLEDMRRFQAMSAKARSNV